MFILLGPGQIWIISRCNLFYKRLRIETLWSSCSMESSHKIFKINLMRWTCSQNSIAMMETSDYLPWAAHQLCDNFFLYKTGKKKFFCRKILAKFYPRKQLEIESLLPPSWQKSEWGSQGVWSRFKLSPAPLIQTSERRIFDLISRIWRSLFDFDVDNDVSLFSIQLIFSFHLQKNRERLVWLFP